MDSIFDRIGQWIHDFLVECILGNLAGMFDQVNETVGNVASDVARTPQDWELCCNG